MKAIYCDICEKLMQAKFITEVFISGVYNEDGNFELCDNCKNKLTRLLKW